HDALFKQVLFKLENDRYYWYQKIHHIAADAFGFFLISRRIAHTYTALVQDQKFNRDGFQSIESVIEEDVSYRNSEKYRQDRKFWMDRLQDIPEIVSLAERSTRLPHCVTRHTGHISQDTIAA